MPEFSIRKGDRRVSSLENERSSFIPVWQDLTDHFRVHRGRYQLDDVNSGKRRDLKLLNNKTLLAARVLQAGMMSGITSPARPWFRLSTGDEELDQLFDVRDWLHTCSKILYRVFSMSNLYNSLHTYYGEISTFGTASMGVYSHPRDFLIFETMTAGQYSLGLGRDGRVDTQSIRRKRRVAELVKDYGLENCPQHVRNLWKNGGENTQIEVVQLVEPNDDRDQTSPFSWNKPWRSVTWAVGTRDNEPPLRISGFDQFPFMAGRWDVAPGDIYGTDSPGLTALGDAKSLQVAEHDILTAMARIADPTLIADQRLRRVLGDNTPAPGRMVYAEDIGQGVKDLFGNYRPDLGSMGNMAGRYEQRIDAAFYVDLFLMLSESDRRQVTAREVVEKHEEKLLQIGPVLERMHNELLDPLIDRTFSLLQEAGVLPEPPEALVGRDLRVEYISVMAQAQKLVTLQSTERVAGFAMQLAQLDPSIVDRINADRMLSEYNETVGNDPENLRSDEEVAELRAQRAQAQQAAQMQEAMGQMASAARDASQADLSGDNALSTVMRQAGLA